MIQTNCNCGQRQTLAESQVNLAAPCPGCGRAIIPVSAQAASIPGDFVSRLVVEDGPQRTRDLILLGGQAELLVGRQAGRHIVLPDATISRLHCRLVRIPDRRPRWKIVDAGSRTGILVNGRGVREHELSPGDEVQLGAYQLRYLCDLAAARRIDQEQKQAALTQPICPSCSRTLPPGATICTDCGVDVATGRALVISRDVQRDLLEERLWLFIGHLSWLPPFCMGVLPAASEAFSTRSRIATWIIAAVTVVASLVYLPVVWDDRPTASPWALRLMCWPGTRQELTRYLDDTKARIERDLDAQRQAIDGSTPRGQAEQTELDRFRADLPRMLQERIPPDSVGFEWYQLLTHGWLHGGIVHLLGNLIFLLLFGLRVSEAIGTWRMLVIYPLLMAASGFVHAAVNANGPLMPVLGASGAVMGLAGIYVVLFPLQKIHVVAWFQGYFLTEFQCLFRMFAMRGIWALLALVVWTDLVPMALRREDSVAHWAHLGGFVAGVMVGLLLLVTRQARAYGADLVSVTLGRWAWPLVGRPGGGPAAAAAPRPRPAPPAAQPGMDAAHRLG